MVVRLGADMPRVMRANPVVQVPSDVLLVGRVLGLLSGVGKQLGAHVDLAATLLPYLAAAQRAPAGAPPGSGSGTAPSIASGAGAGGDEAMPSGAGAARR